jgi:hypothetical protein
MNDCHGYCRSQNILPDWKQTGCKNSVESKGLTLGWKIQLHVEYVERNSMFSERSQQFLFQLFLQRYFFQDDGDALCLDHGLPRLLRLDSELNETCRRSNSKLFPGLPVRFASWVKKFKYVKNNSVISFFRFNRKGFTF